jgi:hypothetical protein
MAKKKKKKVHSLNIYFSSVAVPSAIRADGCHDCIKVHLGDWNQFPLPVGVLARATNGDEGAVATEDHCGASHELVAHKYAPIALGVSVGHLRNGSAGAY